MSQLVLLDNTVLANFAAANCAELVMRLWSQNVCMTTSVRAEHEAGIHSRLFSADAWANLPIIALNEAETAFAARLSSRLGAGERTSIAAAVHRQGLFASDDADARGIARRHGVPVTGTVGILVTCAQHGLISHAIANQLLATMIAAGYRSPVADLDSFFKFE